MESDRRFEELRRRAESAIALRPVGDHRPDDRELERVVHELEVHQVELEMQNEELRESQRALLDSRDRYYKLYELALVGYLSLDRKGIIHEANLAAAKVLGAARPRLVGRPLSSFLDEPEADALYRHLGEVFESGEQRGCDLVLRGDGSRARRTPIHLDSTPVAGVGGSPSQCQCALIDLSELRGAQEASRIADARRKTAEAEIRQSEHQFQQIADHLEDVLAIVDHASRNVVYASRGFEALSGRARSELCGHGAVWLDWIHPDDRARMEDAYRSRHRDDPFDEECRLVRPDHGVRWLRVRAFPIEEASGQPQRDVVIIQDITGDRDREEERRQAEKMEAIGTLATGVAHDFGNVLQAVLGCIDLAREDGGSREQTLRYLDHAARALRHGAHLASQLMAFSHRGKIAPRPLELDASLREIAELLGRLVTERVTLSLHTGASGAMVVADNIQIEQILMNLVANARDAMPQGGTLTIRTDVLEPGDAAVQEQKLDPKLHYLRLIVQDSGAGMDEQTRQRVFEPFFTTKEISKGTGLGLTRVVAVMRQLGGSIRVESELGRGSAFTLLFPVCGGASPSWRTSAHEEPHFRGTALLVEDERLIRMTVSHYLKELGLDVLEAADAAEALRLSDLHHGRIDLLVSDVVLPRTPGTTLASMMRARHPNLPVLLVSASAPQAIADGPAAIEYPVLAKPFGRAELAEQLAALLTPESEDHAAEQARAQRTIMLVEDDSGSREALAALFVDEGFRVLAATTAAQALDLARGESRIDLLISDLGLPCMTGRDLAEELRQQFPLIDVIYVSGLSEPADLGDSFLQKPVDFNALMSLVERKLSLHA